MIPFGLRSYLRIDYTTPNQVVTVDPSGAYVFVEVTNPNTSSPIDFYPNTNLPITNQSTVGGITVAANSTRQIPMTVYNFRATGNCTVIAYRM